jgi:hypothetical protein
MFPDPHPYAGKTHALRNSPSPSPLPLPIAVDIFSARSCGYPLVPARFSPAGRPSRKRWSWKSVASAALSLSFSLCLSPLRPSMNPPFSPFSILPRPLLAGLSWVGRDRVAHAKCLRSPRYIGQAGGRQGGTDCRRCPRTTTLRWFSGSPVLLARFKRVSLRVQVSAHRPAGSRETILSARDSKWMFRTKSGRKLAWQHPRKFRQSPRGVGLETYFLSAFVRTCVLSCYFEIRRLVNPGRRLPNLGDARTWVWGRMNTPRLSFNRPTIAKRYNVRVQLEIRRQN